MEKDWIFLNPHSNESLANDPVPVPFEVVFSLPSSPKGRFVLHLDAICRYRRPAIPRYEVSINGKSGSYQLVPRPSPELWWNTGGEAEGGIQYIGYASLDMVLPASYFLSGTNRMALRCLDGFGIYYDSLSLTNEADGVIPLVTEASFEPTVLFKNRSSGLVELVQLRMCLSRPVQHAKVRVTIGPTQVEKEISHSTFGDVEAIFEVPVTNPRETLPVAVFLEGTKKPLYRGIFKPKRRWQVYALPMEQADFGYNDLPARTLEWENRFLDKALEIQKEYPSYSFTLDASANLESYLATRDEAHGKQLLDHLRGGKFGINALYENFFTGLATPEELIHMLEYALLAGRQHGFSVDSGSQTDEPSIAWALAQIMAEAGIKYFSNGSDPIRGPFNPIGLLNFRSPFYWEAPNGNKVLAWSAVSYTGVDDMTWGGWNAEAVRTGKYSPSLLGLEHSLPLFLSQYDREDFPFNAILLYGLHNDEIPIRHYGSTDVIEQWNQQYAYPKIIPGTQRDFFNYIVQNFGSQIQTCRGDGGSYWEDEAGADAAIAAMIRTSQTQILAAEKFESVANWLKPLLRFDYGPFLEAWKNLMLSDSYVWSDATSFSKPYSYRTRYGESAHRAWAAAADQQSWDLRLVALDKISELIESDKVGAVVFNPESWPRSDLFDFELEPDEILMDPSSNQPIPCGSMRSLNGYQEVRCWAADVPALGYKFYPVTKGKVPGAESVILDSAAPKVEGMYYQLRLDPHTGAVAQLTDKATGQDLVKSSFGYGINEYLYVTGGDPGAFLHGSNNDNRILAADATLPIPELKVNRAELTEAPQAQHFPWGTVVTIHRQALNTPQIVSTITLHEKRKLISFSNLVQKAATLKKEGVYFAFPFAVEKPQLQYQGATAWVNPEVDMLPGANRQWFTTQGGVRIAGTRLSVGWASADAPLITLEDINRGLWPGTIQILNGNVFSYVMNNYWYTDAPAQQGGQFTFRYALTSDSRIEIPEATQLALEQRSPFPVLRHYNQGWRQTLPETGTGFVTASPPGVVVFTIRPMAGEDTYLLRIHNATPQAVKAKLQFPMTVLEEAHLGTVLGDQAGSVDWSAHEVQVPLGRCDLKSLVVRLKISQD
jgi:hypothetical protein